MRKITLLLSIICYSFTMNGMSTYTTLNEEGKTKNTNCRIEDNSNKKTLKAHKFYSKIKGIGDITKSLAINNCDITYNSNQLDHKRWVDIPIEKPLEPKKFYYLDIGYGKKYYYLAYSSYERSSDADERLDNDNDIQKIECRRSHKFYSKIKGIGDITKSLAINNCDITYNSNQLDHKRWVDIPIEKPLEPKKFYYLDIGYGKKYYYLAYSSYERSSDADERLDNDNDIQKIECLDSDNDGTPDFKDNCPTQTGPSINNGCPIKDSDNDGVPDSEDNCPNEAGSTSNNGCPASNEPAKIEIQNIVVKKSSDDKVVFNSEVNNSKLILNNNNDYSIEVEIKNVGGEIQKKIMWVIAESRDNKFNQFNDCINTGGGSAEYSINLAPDEVKTEKKEISIYDSIMALCTVKQSGYLIVSINNDIYYSIPYNYSSESSESRSLATNSQTIKQKPYIIDVYNFKGQKVLSREVKNAEEENKATLSLPKGIYIIKSKNGDRKIYID